MLDWLRKTILPIGERIAGGIRHVGQKISEIGHKAVNFVEGLPVIGNMARPFTSIARAGLGVVDGVSNVAGAVQNWAKNPSTEGVGDIINAGLAAKAPVSNLAETVRSSGLLRKR